MNTVKNNEKICDICKRNFEGPRHYIEGLILCPSCAVQLHTCRGCEHRENCEAERNPKGYPTKIVKTLNHDNQTFSVAVPNPQLREYCEECLCAIGRECVRILIGYCTNWELHHEYRRDKSE